MKIVKIPSSTELGYYFDQKLIKQLLASKKKVEHGNQDRVFIVDGREGSGKSTLAVQMANIVDPDFQLEQIVFTSEQFDTLTRKIDRYKAVVFDEAFNGLSSKGAMSKENKKLIRLLMECRQRNLFIFIVLPSIFMLEKYVAIFRSQALFHTRIQRNKINQRFFQVYNYEDKTQLYILGKQMMNYNKPRIRNKHRFYGKFPEQLDYDSYLTKKLKSFRDMNIEEEAVESKYKVQRNLLVYYLNKTLKVKQKDIASLFNNDGFEMGREGITKIVQQYLKRGNGMGENLIYIGEKGVGGVNGVINNKTPSEAAPLEL